MRLLPTILIMLLMLLALSACGKPAPPTMTLDLAVETGNLDQLKRHLFWDTEIEQPDADGDYPLHIAAESGRVVIARTLIRRGDANLEVLNAAGQTPLELALVRGRAKMAQMLIREGAAFDPQTALARLVRDGHAARDIYEFLLARGADPSRGDDQGFTPLHLAAAGGHLAAASRLLHHGAAVNPRDAAGRTPLDLAIAAPRSAERESIVRLLERHGARPGDPAATPSPDDQEPSNG